MIKLSAGLVAFILPVAAAAQADACFPGCRSGFVCIAAQCVSACNPLCAAGETCTANGECLPAAPLVSPVAAVAPIVQVPVIELERSEPRPTAGWARGAAVMGLVFAGTLAGATAFNELFLDETSVQLPLRLALHGTGVIMAPIVAGGAGSARDANNITGSGGSRALGWLTYVLSLVSGTSQLVLGAFGLRLPYGPFMTQGLSSMSMAFFAIDGFVAAAQADSAAEVHDAREQSRLRIAPVVSVSGNGGSVGLAASF